MKPKYLYSTIKNRYLGIFTLSIFILASGFFMTSCKKNSVTVSTDSGPTSTNCGGFDWRVKFDLKNPSKGGGWIVQEIEIKNNIKNCDGTDNNVSTIHYWEAWEIKDKQSAPDLSRNTLGLTFDDMWVEPDHPNTRNYQDNRGKVRYFEGVNLPATMVANNPAVPGAGILHADTVAPPFWNNGASNTDHNLYVSWNCCDTAFVSELRTTPSTSVRGVDKLEFHDKIKESATVPYLIQSIPSWLGGYDKSKTADLIQIGAKLSVLTDHEIRDGIQEFSSVYSGANDYLWQISKVYLLLRVLFDVPANIPINQAKVFGGWGHPSAGTGNTFNLLWPLEMSMDSTLNVVGGFSGYYGAPYDAVGEYDYFSEGFGRREIIK